MSDISFECSSCNKRTKVQTSSSVTSWGRSFDVNRRAVYNALETGSGYQGLASFCSIMNIPCMSKTAYYKQVENIVNEQENEAKEEMKRAGERLRKTVLSENEEDQSQVVDVTVSFDGTWAKRGFTSLTGVVFVISLDTGEVLDSHVLCKSCSKCAIKKSRCNDEKEF